MARRSLRACSGRNATSGNATSGNATSGTSPTLGAFSVVALLLCPSLAHAQDATPGFPEKVVQWGTQKGDTCEDISKALYGDARHAHLVLRYNRVVCTRGAPLKAGLSLVMPAAVTVVPTAQLRSVVPAVQARPAGGGWSDAGAGAPLPSNSSVKTLAGARADIQFIDRTRVFLAENTLVVVFGSAAQSAVSKLPPPAVVVEQGELKAAINALRGGSAEIAIAGGGRVSAESSDTVIERKATRTTVSVFDGKAQVANAGKSVSVPKNFGSRFLGNAPPIPPRPLPKAPEFDQAPPSITFAGDAGLGVLSASWRAVDKARAYRVELAKDEAFDEVLLRQEVPSETLSFRAERLPVGRYFLRVRAIDQEDFLGIGSQLTPSEVVKLSLPGGALPGQDGTLPLSRYALLDLAAASGAEISLDDGAFVPLPSQLDLLRSSPTTLRIRSGQSIQQVNLIYQEASATLLVNADQVRLTVLGTPGIDVLLRVQPSLLVQREGQTEPERVAVRAGPAPNVLLATLPAGGKVVAIDVVDGRGRRLGSWSPGQNGAEPAVLAAPAPRFIRIGVASPHFGPNKHLPSWWSPTAPAVAAATLAMEQPWSDTAPNMQGRILASGAWGPVSLEGAFHTDDLETPREAHETAWLGLRLRMIQLDDSALEAGPRVRLGVPLSNAEEVEAAFGLAVGGAADAFSWLFSLEFDMDSGEAAYAFVPSLVGGLTYDPLSWLRTYGTLDVYAADVARDPRAAFGVTLGAEAGDHVFGGLSARIAPVDAPLGGFTGALHLGVRSDP